MASILYFYSRYCPSHVTKIDLSHFVILYLLYKTCGINCITEKEKKKQTTQTLNYMRRNSRRTYFFRKFGTKKTFQHHYLYIYSVQNTTTYLYTHTQKLFKKGSMNEMMLKDLNHNLQKSKHSRIKRRILWLKKTQAQHQHGVP